MPWQLDASYNIGDLDTVLHDQVKIVRMTWDDRSQSISVVLEYGTTNDGKWIVGLPPVGKSRNVNITGDDYINFTQNHMSQNGELTYNAVKRGLYEWLSDNGYLDAGSVV